MSAEVAVEQMVEETPMKSKLEKVQTGTPKLAQSTEKGRRPNKLQAPEDFKFFSQLAGPFDLFFESFVPKYRTEHSAMEKSKLKQNVLLNVARQMWDKEMDAESKVEFNSEFVRLCTEQEKEIIWESDEEAAPKQTKKRGRPSAGGAKVEKKEKRKKGEPREPKAQGGWMTFLAEYRPIFKAENPDVKGVTECTKAAGVIWKTKTAEEKEEYKQKGIKIFEEKQNGETEDKSEDKEQSDEEMSEESEEENVEAEEGAACEEEGKSRKRKAEKVEETPEEIATREEEAAAKKATKEERRAKMEHRKAEKEQKELEKELASAKKEEEKEAKAEIKKAEKEAKAANAAEEKLKKSQEKEEHEKLNPKKPQTAYFMFLAEFRPKYAAENPESKGVTEVSKAAGEAWGKLSDEEKVPYHAQHEEATTKYKERCAELGIEVKSKAPPKPKKARVPTAFELYVQAKEDLARRRFPGVEGDAFDAKLVGMWKLASKSEKTCYADKVKAIKAKAEAAALAPEAEPAAGEEAEAAEDKKEEAEPAEEEAAEADAAEEV